MQPQEELQALIFPWIEDLETECRASIKEKGSEFSGNLLLPIICRTWTHRIIKIPKSGYYSGCSFVFTP